MLGSLVTIQKKEEGATSLTADEDFTMHSTEKKRGKKKKRTRKFVERLMLHFASVYMHIK